MYIAKRIDCYCVMVISARVLENAMHINILYSLFLGSGSEDDDFEDALDYHEKITIPSPAQPNHR